MTSLGRGAGRSRDRDRRGRESSSSLLEDSCSDALRAPGSGSRPARRLGARRRRRRPRGGVRPVPSVGPRRRRTVRGSMAGAGGRARLQSRRVPATASHRRAAGPRTARLVARVVDINHGARLQANCCLHQTIRGPAPLGGGGAGGARSAAARRRASASSRCSCSAGARVAASGSSGPLLGA